MSSSLLSVTIQYSEHNYRHISYNIIQVNYVDQFVPVKQQGASTLTP